ncbi:hypothetical protein DFP72DRAFT_541035 [Ephemerocybe angulata]|uniref:F-box domain-containing protein n=1 Tax=Ephemerocybe angulata TaxID=980116 RepID=A0A8H6M2X7_9AGAR|nr:hypothetical protein DFP72DRAFT_541035 [Tulosesus angulatus]
MPGGVFAPVPRLLRCNDPPTEAESASILSHITAIQAELSRQRDGNPQPPHDITQRGWHVESLRLHRSLLYGVRNIPEEIMETIFDQALQVPGPNRRHIILNRIMRVSQRWRAIALEFSPLWSKLPDVLWDRDSPFTDGSVGIDRICEVKEAVILYLERSRNHPITFLLRINHGTHEDTRVLEEAERLFETLILHVDRWATVDLSISFKLLRIHSRSIIGNLPQLHSLNLKVTNWEQCTVRAIDCFTSCPSLQHFSLATRNWYSHDELVSEMQWAQLKTFEDRRETSLASRTFAKRSESATTGISCDIKLGDREYMEKQLSQFSASDITELNVNCSGSDMAMVNNAIQYFAESLTLPKLVGLKLDVTEAWSPNFSLNHVLSFIRRSGCSLKRLHLIYELLDIGAAPPGALSQILALSDELEDLRCSLIPPNTLKSMTLDATSPANILVPELRVLRIRTPPYVLSTWSSKLDPALLNDLARSRIDTQSADSKLELMISFEDQITCSKVFCSLESERWGYPTTTESPSQMAKMKAWRTGLRYLGGNFGNRLSSTYYKEGWKLNEIIKEMEAYSITGFEQMLLLQKYDIPELLDRASYVSAERIPCASMYKLSERLLAMKEKFWHPFLHEIDDGRRWVTKNNGFCLAYV